MSPALLRLLTLCLIALLYLFFLRVVQAVWAEVRPPRAARESRVVKRRPAATPGRVVLVEPAEHAGRVHIIGDEVNIGRAAGCEITIDDSYASQIHARIFRRDDGVFVEDLGSTNGSYLNREKVNRPMAISTGDRLQIGATVFEVST
jgi:hypothetical protein